MAIRLTFGNYFYFVIIHYERYGEDPKKRSLKNQLIVLICEVISILSWIIYPINAYNIFVGPITSWIAHIVIVNQEVLGLAVFVTLAEFVILQNLMLFKFSETNSINEEYWSRFIKVWNWTFSYGISMSLNYSVSTVVSKFSFLTGNLETSEKKDPIRIILWLILVLIVIIGYATKTIKQWIENKKDEEIVAHFRQKFNTKPMNSSLINRKTLVTFFLFNALIVIVNIYCRRFIEDPMMKIIGLIYIELFSNLYFGVLFPLILICFNKNLRRHLREI